MGDLGIDDKCYELARHFLADMYAGSGDEQLLAEAFQIAAENFCRDLAEKTKPAITA